MSEAIVLTGVTSGFGAAALKIIVEKTDAPIIAGARRPATLTEIYGTRVTALPLDLASFASVNEFLAEIPKDLAIGALGLNAGLTLNRLSTTEDGIETTIQVNYLSHVMIYKALESQLTPTARILTTGSGTHDPAEKTPVSPPRYTDLEVLMNPLKQPKQDRVPIRAAGRAYSTSKLLCILMATAIAKQRPSGSAYSFDPGFLPDTNLAREAPKLVFAIVKRLIPLMLADKGRTGTIATTAPHYADMILGKESPAQNGGYVSVRAGELIATDPSELAQTPGLVDDVWQQTEQVLATLAAQSR